MSVKCKDCAELEMEWDEEKQKHLYYCDIGHWDQEEDISTMNRFCSDFAVNQNKQNKWSMHIAKIKG